MNPPLDVNRVAELWARRLQVDEIAAVLGAKKARVMSFIDRERRGPNTHLFPFRNAKTCEHKEAVRMLWAKGLRASEIALMLKVSENRVWNVVANARRNGESGFEARGRERKGAIYSFLRKFNHEECYDARLAGASLRDLAGRYRVTVKAIQKAILRERARRQRAA